MRRRSSAVRPSSCWAIRGLVESSWKALPLASLCWGAAVGTRLSLAPAIGLLVILTCVWLLRQSRTLWHCLWICLPFGASVALLLAYNHARFGSLFEFGRTYQITGFNARTLPAAEWQSPGYFLPNLLRYALQPMRVLDGFPFLHPSTMGSASLSALHVPARFVQEPCAGLLIYMPVVWFALVPALRLPARKGSGHDITGWLCLSLASVVCLAGFLALIQLGSTMRYLEDVAPALLILSAIGSWKLLTRGGRLAPAALGLLAAVTCAVGILLGLGGLRPVGWNHFLGEVSALIENGG